VADLRPVAVRDHNPRIARKQRLQIFERLRGMGELLGYGPRLARTGDGVTAKRDDKRFCHNNVRYGSTAAARLTEVVGQPFRLRTRIPAGPAGWKAGCGQDCPPHNLCKALPKRKTKWHWVECLPH